VTTALVTGASTGLGRAFATALAARGHDLVLVARDVERLEQVAGSVRAAHASTVEVLDADLVTDAGRATVEARVARRDAPVELLVNNAGFGTYGTFTELELAHEIEEVELNVVALVRLTHVALRTMGERGHGAIVNLGSIAAYQPHPENAVYGATKAFVHSFTHAVREEARSVGVQVLLVSPGYTHTEFHERAGLGASSLPDFMWQTPDEVVAIALRDLDRGRSNSIPGAFNRGAAVVSSTAPPGLTRKFARLVVRRTG
jgi:short-subunit dehydrogenase